MPFNERLSIEELHQNLLDALRGLVISHSPVKYKPLEINLKWPLPPKLRVYLFNATYPPGGRTMGEHKIQLIVPGQSRGSRGNFDSSGGRMPILMGYRADISIFILWDADLYFDFSYSRNVQVMPETVYQAFAQGIGRQTRRLRNSVTEIVITCNPKHLSEALLERQQITINRLLSEKNEKP